MESEPGADVEPVAGAAEEAPLDQLEAALGVRFRDRGLLRLALTHRSVLHDVVAAGEAPLASRTNERLEFLGDALLGAVAAEHLYAADPAADEGALTRRRVALVRAETLVRWARALDLGAYLYLGVGERPSSGARDRMLAGAFEALVGAIALDQGQRAVRRFLRRFLVPELASVVMDLEHGANPKGRLQEVLQERFRRGPLYRISAVAGPAHDRRFTAEVLLGSEVLGAGAGASKREAEQAAARAALAQLPEGELPLLLADAVPAG